MGCDIHLNLEYLHPKHGITPVIANAYSVSRDYQLFCTLAGVRNYDDVRVLFPPRGIPEDVSWEVFLQFFMQVTADDAPDWQRYLGCDTCSPSDAERYVSECHSFVREVNGVQYVSTPGWHDASVLSYSEILLALEYSAYPMEEMPNEFRLVLRFMEAIDQQFGAGSSRIVFWFDN